MTTVATKDRDPHFANEPPRRPPQVACKRDDESPPRSRLGAWWRASETPADLASQLWQPPRKPTPVTNQQVARLLHARSIHLAIEESLDNGVANQAIRLREIWQHADTPPTRPATKPPDQEPQISRTNSRHPALIVAECNQHPSLPAIWTQFWATHACLHLLTEILLRRTLHPDDDLHSGHSSCRNHAHDQ